MIALLTVLPILAVAVQSPQAERELTTLAREGPDSVLIERVRRGTYDVREVLRQLLAAASRSADSAEGAALTAAERLASAWVVAWQDSFYVRRVNRFRSLSLADRQANASADSVLRAGNDALTSVGVDAAMQGWRESLRLYEVLADSAGIARALGNLGVGFRRIRQYDSAETYMVRAGDLAERLGEYRTLGDAIGNLGLVESNQGNWERARELFVRAKPIRERIGDVRGLARDQQALGNVAFTLGDLAGARRAFVIALAAFQSADDGLGTANTQANLGSLARRQGDYSEAAALYNQALSRYRGQGNQLPVPVTLYNLGALAMARGDYPAALAALTEAAEILGRLGGVGATVTEIEIRRELAAARTVMGDLQGARIELRRAETLASKGGRRASLAMLAVTRGNLASRFNRWAEAEREYTRALRLARGRADTWWRQAAQHGMGHVLLIRGSYQRAQLVLERSLVDSVDSHNAAETRLMIARTASRRGDYAAARRGIIHALTTLQTLGDVAGEAEALGALGDLAAQTGGAVAAESLYRRGLARLGDRSVPGIAWELHAGLADALWSRGALPEAAQELSLAISEIERVSGNLPLEEQRAAFRANKWDVYVELALVERARGRTEAAFEASERLRARQMLDLLARGRPATPGATRGTLASREQDLRRKIAVLTRQLEAPGDGRGLRDPMPSESEAGAASEALARAQEEYAELLVELREADPSYAALVRGEIAPASAVRAALAPDEALLEYLVGDSTTIVFVVTADTLAALDLRVNHSALTAQVDFARGTLGSPTEGGARRAWRPSLRRLYRQLVAPVEASGLLAGKRRLIIAPHAELHYLPFAALVRPGPPEQLLVERYVLEYVPSASVWLRLRDQPAAAPAGGIVAFAPRPAALPGSRAEVAAIQRTFGDRAQTLVGRVATESTFRVLAPEHEIVHIATYGVLNKHNPLFSFIDLGAGGGEDGRLEVHEVFGLGLGARLVVLSACQTGVAAGALADVPPGDDWVGLVQGFLSAGAGNVLATLWPVSDIATARLMERFYEELAAGRPEAEALAVAQRAAVRVPATAHPFYWAGFTLVRGR